MLVAVNAGKLKPVPALPSPIDELVFVQRHSVAVPENDSILTVALLQYTWSESPVMVGSGFTVMVKGKGVPMHEAPALM